MIVSSSVPVVPFAIVILPICADAHLKRPVPIPVPRSLEGTIVFWNVTTP